MNTDGPVTNMDCADLKALLSAYVDDELLPERRHAADRHLAGCASCRAIVSEAEGLDALIAMDASAHAEGAHLTPEFIGGVLSRTAYAEPMPRAGRLRRWSLWTGWMAAAASLSLAAILWTLERPGTPVAMDPPALSAPERSPADPAAAQQRQAQPHADGPFITPAVYTTGANFRSETRRHPLPAEAFAPLPEDEETGGPVLADAAAGEAEPAAAEVEAEVQASAAPRTYGEPILRSVRRALDPAFEFARAVERASHETAATRIEAEEAAQAGVHDLEPEDAEALRRASDLLASFAGVDLPLRTYEQVERIRAAAEKDDLLPRLGRARERVCGHNRLAVMDAERVFLRLADGPLNEDDVRLLRDAVAEMDLPAQIARMSG